MGIDSWILQQYIANPKVQHLLIQQPHHDDKCPFLWIHKLQHICTINQTPILLPLNRRLRNIIRIPLQHLLHLRILLHQLLILRQRLLVLTLIVPY